MSSFDDLSECLKDFSGSVRLFPLPDLVLFPHIMQPLHVFEPRYRDLLEEALSSDRLIAMAALAPGWEKDYEGRPPLYPMACLGQITAHCRLPNGTYNVLLLGVRRVRLIRELTTGCRFREATVEICEDRYSSCSLVRQRTLQRLLHASLLRMLPRLPEAREQLDQLLGSELPLGVLTDLIGYMLDLDLPRKQALLAEVDVYRRAEFLLRLLSPAARDETLPLPSSSYFPPLFSHN